MKVKWSVLAIVALLCFFVPATILANATDRSGAGMVGIGFLLFVVPPALLAAIVAQVAMLNTRFRAYPAYALVGIVSAAAGIFLS